MRLRRLACFILIASLVSLPVVIYAQPKPTWIWYPGDYEVWLGNKMQNRRTERGAFFPPFWRMDNHYVLIDFHKDFELSSPEEIAVYTEGSYNAKIDSKMLEGSPSKIQLPAGKHRINIKVYCQDRVPALFVTGRTVVSDSSWLVTYEDKEWIDATGKVSDQSGTTWLNAGSWNFMTPAERPSQFALSTQAIAAVSTEKGNRSLVADFGKETFGFLKLHGLNGKGSVNIYFGESMEECLSTDKCETLDHVTIDLSSKKDSVLALTKAFRFVNVKYDAGVSVDSVSMLYEFLPIEDKGSFTSSDEELNKIWQISSYTLHLNTREFFIDGIKRDRWIWSGDAYQSYLMNYYLLFDNPSVSRTLFALRGKDPVTSHINTIMDYTFYWFMGIYDYYQYTGDKSLIKQLYPRMQSLMDYCLSRRNASGMMEGLAGDWVFIDWADGLSKQGEVSFEQILFCRSLETMALCANLMNEGKAAANYTSLASDLKKKILNQYWDESKQALVHSRIDGKPTSNVTRYANMFAIFFDYLTADQKAGVKKNVLLNDGVQKITTPYMRFYELEALCNLGEQAYVLKEIKDYWGGMLKLGATSFWEKYDPSEKGAEHYAMYGRPFGKSLCHAWGASPIYLMGKYYLGVKPTSPGYESYSVEPKLGGLQWIKGKVPVPNGSVNVYCSMKQITVSSETGTGLLKFSSKKTPVAKGSTIKSLGGNNYEVTIEKGKEVNVTYTAL